MLVNFTRPEGEEPFYFSSTVEGGEVIKHDGDMAHAVYLSEMRETSRRADLWHAWVEANVPHAYDGLGIIDQDVYATYHSTMQQFMRGEREE